jgi:ArsR family transcriptional regulator
VTKPRRSLPPRTLERIAERFRLLGDPVRLRLLDTLRRGELSVAELCAVTGCGQANVSKHLQLLLRGGLVARRRRGLHAFYSVSDPHVFELCDVVCGSLASFLAQELDSVRPAGTMSEGRVKRRKKATRG